MHCRYSCRPDLCAVIMIARFGCKPSLSCRSDPGPLPCKSVARITLVGRRSPLGNASHTARSQAGGRGFHPASALEAMGLRGRSYECPRDFSAPAFMILPFH